MKHLMITAIAAGCFHVCLLTSANADATNIPKQDPQLFAALLEGHIITEDWIEPAARSELSPTMLREIARRLKSQGGTYQGPQKTSSGWLLQFQNGQVRARIVRSKSGLLVGVFFSDLE